MVTPATPEARTAAWRHLKQFLHEQEAEHRRLLSMWVSELEPEFVYSRDAMQLIGITVKGWDKVIFYAKGWTRSAQRSHDFWLSMTFNPTRPAPRDFCWSDVDLAVDKPDREVTMVTTADFMTSYFVEVKDFDPALGKKLLRATWPRVKK